MAVWDLKIRTAVRAWKEAGVFGALVHFTSAEVSGEDVTAFHFDAGQGRLGREINRSRQMVRMIDAVRLY